MSPIANQIHGWLNTGGIGATVIASLRIAWNIGRTVEKIDGHIKSTGELFDSMHRRVEWLEQHRR